MRIDKYLWCIRFYKTRNNATEACRKGHIKIDDLVVKASKEAFNGDTITIRKNQINYVVKVLDIPKNRLGAKLLDAYRKDITPEEEFKKLELLKHSQEYYRKKGTGRPTKRDRRNLDELYEE